MIDALTTAIKNRKYIEFTYDGFGIVAQPAAIGISSEGIEVLKCYYIDEGFVIFGHEWNLCNVKKIKNLNIKEGHFKNNPPDYKRGDKTMTKIYTEL